MKTYLVGGAVRDQLLQLPIKERDWVVVGATPKCLLEKGFKQVGRDFPVFLHPKTGEEHALARKERKSAPGYYGFECDFDQSITLEEDLLRRDLTINAMAMDENGHLIDPYGGLKDLKEKKLRHVSEAFVEDPVRVLRAARFAARYHHLGFQVAEETRALMYAMQRRGELNHLVPERVWQELESSLGEKNPEVFIRALRACGALQSILPEIDALFGVPAPPHYHPEIDSGIHTLMVLQAASAMTSDPMTRFAALVHDLGKAKTPMSAWPSHHGHEESGVPLIEALCLRLRIPTQWRKFAKMVSQQHLNIHRLFELRANTIVSILEKTDAFRQGEKFAKLLLVCNADAAGKASAYEQAEKWAYLLEECRKINIQELLASGLTGMAIKNQIHARRTSRVKEILSLWKQNNDEKCQ